jgi:hypothetical protein
MVRCRWSGKAARGYRGRRNAPWSMGGKTAGDFSPLVGECPIFGSSDLPTRKNTPVRGRFRLFARPNSRDRTGWLAAQDSNCQMRFQLAVADDPKMIRKPAKEP